MAERQLKRQQMSEYLAVRQSARIPMFSVPSGSTMSGAQSVRVTFADQPKAQDQLRVEVSATAKDRCSASGADFGVGSTVQENNSSGGT